MCQDISYQELSQPLDVHDKNGLYVLSSVACVSAEVRREKMTKSNPRQLRRRKLRYKHPTEKIIEYKQQGDIAFQLLVKAQSYRKQLTLREIMNYFLTPVPYSIGTSDIFFTRTDEAKGLHYLFIYCM